jgi:hypothetical protein
MGAATPPTPSLRQMPEMRFVFTRNGVLFTSTHGPLALSNPVPASISWLLLHRDAGARLIEEGLKAAGAPKPTPLQPLPANFSLRVVPEPPPDGVSPMSPTAASTFGQQSITGMTGAGSPAGPPVQVITFRDAAVCMYNKRM